MVDLLIADGTVVTLNENREILENCSVAIDDDLIVDVGPTRRLKDEYDAVKTIDASEHAVLPGFITTHAHVSDVILRGTGNDRSLFDWLYNIKRPGTNVMTPEEHAVASALYCVEAIQSGITTVVEFAVGNGSGYSRAVKEAKFDVYDTSGIRNVFARGFIDRDSNPTIADHVKQITSKEPSVAHAYPETSETESELRAIESLIEKFDGTADGRQRIWIAPLWATAVTPEGYSGVTELAERYDVMATTHTSETALQEGAGPVSNVEYLNDVGFLGERTLLAHCVHVDERDVRLLAGTDTRVAHNPVTNLAIADGVAPVPEMDRSGVTVAMGTDNASASDTVNMLNDLRVAAMVHKGVREDAGVLTSERVLEMATIDAARAIGRSDDFGSIESGKKADIFLLDLDYDHLTPCPNIPSAVVYQAQGFEVDTVLCNGSVVMEDRCIEDLEEAYPDLRDQATHAAKEVIERAGLADLFDRPWTSISTV